MIHAGICKIISRKSTTSTLKHSLLTTEPDMVDWCTCVKYCISVFIFSGEELNNVDALDLELQLFVNFRTEKDSPPLTFNGCDGKINRVSHMGKYEIVDGVPR